MSETITKRFKLTESTEGTPCITGLLEDMDELSNFGAVVTVHNITEDDVVPRVLDVSFTSLYDPEVPVQMSVGAFVAEGSDVTYEEVI